jgi:hypothetical protein
MGGLSERVSGGGALRRRSGNVGSVFEQSGTQLEARRRLC